MFPSLLFWFRLSSDVILAPSSRPTLSTDSTMKLQTSDQGTIIMGAMAASCTGVTNVGFYLIGMIYGFTTFYSAAGVYLEAYRNVPDDCRQLIKYMAYSFYGGWLMFPLLFILGPEGACSPEVQRSHPPFPLPSRRHYSHRSR
eukprot:346544-Prorocentrum_minimum.AAC.2